MNRRQFLGNSAAGVAGLALLTETATAVSAAPAALAAASAPPLAGRTPITTLNGRSLPYTLRNGVKLGVSRNGYAEIRSTYLEWKGQFGDD